MYLYVLYVSCLYVTTNKVGSLKYIQCAQHMHDMHEICTRYKSTYIQYMHIHTTYGLTPLLYVYVCCMYCKIIHTHIVLIHTKVLRAVETTRHRSRNRCLLSTESRVAGAGRVVEAVAAGPWPRPTPGLKWPCCPMFSWGKKVEASELPVPPLRGNSSSSVYPSSSSFKS